jgi:hypothetical protein
MSTAVSTSEPIRYKCTALILRVGIRELGSGAFIVWPSFEFRGTPDSLIPSTLLGRYVASHFEIVLFSSLLVQSLCMECMRFLVSLPDHELPARVCQASTAMQESVDHQML